MISPSASGISSTAASLLPARLARTFLSDTPQKWHDEAVQRLRYLCGLEPGWDHYAAPPLSPATANFALRVLAQLCPPDCPSPGIVPGASGDVQLEWHVHAGDIEIHVRAPNDIVAWRCLADGDPAGEEIALMNDLRGIAPWFDMLADSPRAPVASAA